MIYLKQKRNGLYDIHIHVLIETVEGQDVESIATAVGTTTAIHRVR